MTKTTVSLLLCFCTTLFYTNTSLAQDLNPFNEVIISGNVSVLLVASDEESISIKNNEEQLDYYVDGRTLKLKATDLIQYSNEPATKVVLRYKKIVDLRVRAGASAYTEQAMKGEQLTIKFSSGASGEIEVAQNTVEASASEGADLELEGQTEWLEAKVATGGEISAYKLATDNVVVRANTGGNAKVFANRSIDARANTGGSVSYKGNPKKVQQKTGLAGTIRSW
ncbi:MAG: head GIN domain-containing protein [Bacteroidota bacterium]